MKDQLSIIGEDQVCIHCYHIAVNPICEKCYTKQIYFWLSYQEINPKITSNIIKNIKEKFSSENQCDMLCIICNTELVSTCTFCYFFKVENILRKLNLSEKIIDNFLEIFNYKIDRE